MEQTTITYLIGVGSLITMIVTMVMAIKKPQMKSELNDAVFDEKFKNLEKNTHEKINALDKVIVNLRDNHIHTLDQKLDKHIQDNQNFMIENAKWQSRVEVLLEQISKK